MVLRVQCAASNANRWAALAQQRSLMHWQNAILSSPSKRAARQNKYAIYVRYPDGSAVVMPKKHSGIRDAKSQEVEGFDDWVSLEEFEAAQHSVEPTV